MWQIPGLKPSLFYAIVEKTFLEGYMMRFLSLKEAFATIVTLVSSFLS